MIIHSIIPLEVIFNESDKCTAAKYMEMEYLGEKVQVASLQNNEYRIERILSTSPKAYLNPKLQPGTIIQGI